MQIDLMPTPYESDKLPNFVHQMGVKKKKRKKNQKKIQGLNTTSRKLASVM